MIDPSRASRRILPGLLLVILALFAAGCRSPNRPSDGGLLRPSADRAYLSASPTDFLNGFEQTVRTGDWLGAKRYLDPAYVKEQHDTALEGRTEQFFVELLGLYRVCRGQEHRACLNRVRAIRRLRTPGPAAGAGVPVDYEIRMTGSSEPVRVRVHLKLGPPPLHFSLFGPVG